MTVNIEKQDNHIVATIEGRIDTITAKDFEVYVAKLLEDECINIIIDCEKMNYISSSGLRSFLILQKGVNAKKGTLVLRFMDESIKEIFDITGFSSIFNIK